MMVKWSKFFEGHKFRWPREGLNFEPSVCNKNYKIQDHVSVLFFIGAEVVSMLRQFI